MCLSSLDDLDPQYFCAAVPCKQGVLPYDLLFLLRLAVVQVLQGNLETLSRLMWNLQKTDEILFKWKNFWFYIY